MVINLDLNSNYESRTVMLIVFEDEDHLIYLDELKSSNSSK